MNNEIAIFNFNQNQVRTTSVNDAPYFCLKDTCIALGIKDWSASNFKKGVENIHLLTKGGQQTAVFINEPNLYRLVFRSRKPSAIAFADWVYSEVLPSIRKTGQYSVPDKPVIVSEHTRALPSGKKEIVLSEKAKQEIGGIVKAVVGVAIKEAEDPLIFAERKKGMTVKDELKALMREVIREEIADYSLKGGIKQTPAHNGNVTADGLPVANWIVGIIHGANALDSCINQLQQRQNQAVKLLES